MQILLVEDDRDLRRFLSKAFREEGYGVTETDSGDRALERALEGSFSCLVLDVMLPGRDGFSVVAELRHKDATLDVAGVTLDPLTRRVTQDDRVVDLSPREFALLEFLMRNAGRTVSRSRIAEAVWNYKFDPETNVVDVYVNYLRKKLSFGGRTAPIRTVRGVGYRLEANAGD